MTVSKMSSCSVLRLHRSSVSRPTAALADLDFTGKLDLLTVSPDGQGLRLYRNLGNSYFKEDTTNSGLPAVVVGVEHVTVEDWKNEDVPGVFVTQKSKAPAFYARERAGAFALTDAGTNWPVGSV